MNRWASEQKIFVLETKHVGDWFVFVLDRVLHSFEI